MPLFLLANWKWLLGAAAAAVLGVMLGLAEIKIADLKSAAAKTALAVEVQKTQAQKELADAQAHARDIESQNAALNIQLEKDHADAQQQIADDAVVNRALSTRVGKLLDEAFRRGSCSPSNVPGQSNAAGSSTSTASPSELPGPFQRFVDGVTELFVESDGAAEVGLRCHVFAMGEK